jgi:uncharacterized protein (DUF1501 family)
MTPDSRPIQIRQEGPAPGAPPPTPAPDAAARALSRRRFLALAGGVGAAGVVGATLGPQAWDQLFGGGTTSTASAVTRSSGTLGSPTGRTLVLLTLYGGNDGLNTVIPYEDPGYAHYRADLAIPASSVLPIGQGYGLHPALTGFKKLWDEKQLAIVQGVGFADPNYSHFESMDIWQSGVPTSPVSTGWLGRWLDATKASPLRAIGIGPTLPTILTGERVQGAAIPTGPLVIPDHGTETALYSAMAHPSRRESALLTEAAAANADLLTVNRAIGPILNRTAGADPLHLKDSDSNSLAGGNEAALAIANGGGGRSTDNVLATQLSIVANLILGKAETEVYSVELGGFDTHADQAGTQTDLLGQLGTAVEAFLDAIHDNPRGKETVVLIYTEFGRRVWSNASAGTDHGWANVVFAAGQPVKGGFYGDEPSLSKLSEGNLIYTTDFRRVYATAFDQILGVDPKPFLQGSFPTISFV